MDKNLLESLLHEESELRIPNFSNAMAVELGIGMARRAQAEGKIIAINIDACGQCLFHCALDGTSLHNDLWLAGKTRVVYHFRHSSFYVSKLIQSKERKIEDYYLDPNLYRASGGAFPLILQSGGLVGVVAVSGLPDHEDHAFVTECLRNFSWM